MFKVFKTKEFEKRFSKLDKSLQIMIGNEIDQLEVNPYVGKSLGYKWFREKKVKNQRFYYLIYQEYVIVFVITLSNKKDQQKTINAIKELIPSYREEIKNKFKE